MNDPLETHAMSAPPTADSYGASAPPYSAFDNMPGYEGTLSGGGGEPVDAFTHQPPGPWDIVAQAPTFFEDSKQVIKVPYTSSLKKVCWVCNGAGYRHGEDRCHHCNGRGRDKTNNSSDYVVEQSSGLLLANLNKVTGKELFKDSQYLVR
ncbi:Protein SSUH2 [Merluccius polli]|uniref:Protein SSUH2 n=1 Tax=Merluccius polli TaxID=89951 RepID=A0AA47PCY5_MERPO|nr:Protein SSUH2 [Merluccius polli]